MTKHTKNTKTLNENETEKKNWFKINTKHINKHYNRMSMILKKHWDQPPKLWE